VRELTFLSGEPTIPIGHPATIIVQVTVHQRPPDVHPLRSDPHHRRMLRTQCVSRPSSANDSTVHRYQLTGALRQLRVHGGRLILLTLHAPCHIGEPTVLTRQTAFHAGKATLHTNKPTCTKNQRTIHTRQPTILI
jgi:hypothetical protein